MDSRELHINDLPSEMLLHIFAFLPHLKDRNPLSLVCRRWNDLAFNYNYLSHIRLKLLLDEDNVEKLHKISRYYRSVSLHVQLSASLDDEQIERILTRFEKPSTSLEELVCIDSSASPDFLALKLLAICPSVRKFQLDSDWNIPDAELPVLENLDELIVTGITRVNINRLAPNLRRLETWSELDTLLMVIQKLPLEHLRVDFAVIYVDIFQNCTEVTKLTSVDLFFSPIDQKGLEQLCKFCPLLSKLRLTVTKIASLRCLASLTHLKVLSLYNVNNALFASKDACLPNVEIVEFTIRENLHFDSSMQRVFPNVRYLKFEYFYKGWDLTAATGKVCDGFPRLKTLEFSLCRTKSYLDQLEGMADLRELIVGKLPQLTGSSLPPMNAVQCLTLKNTELEVTGEMVKNLPSLQFVNLYGSSRCIGAGLLPSSCAVRRYLRHGSNDIFDVE
ncbi:uncharacterized protein LOC128742669 [Sabethes cyaneus]|uniref:uncharacterized protein LOC128742669 n=1 Tax=Sabethes cyaneus TaxID=53552 RepID=UPI00237E04A6|nr:uncharacterized protein LOC128742669 [Sabethes cyaneus]XP_053695085.1 uncharacterized protein LOC128742669 [Sabethes cyaneus]